MDRRRFMIRSAQVVGGSLLLPWARALATSGGSDSTSVTPNVPDLVLAKGEAKAATHAALDAIGGIERFVRPKNVVVVKPNASFECPPDWGATTHPDVLSAVLESCFEAGAAGLYEVSIVSSQQPSMLWIHGPQMSSAPNSICRGTSRS